MTSFANQNYERKSMAQFAEEAYLNYSMYVIMDRALPHIGDGLKPVQRRIIYAMSELGLSTSSKHKKSARTVGDVLGKYHPHGDSACYEALVLMAQPFSYRYPLIDGQGNFGSPDNPKSFAAMRYTESKLSRYAGVLLKEIDDGTVEWQANFDGTLNEPIRLPARLPNVLLNGGTGIAVGMATDIPPHNLLEVAKATCALIDQPDLSIEALTQIIPAPDFPTGGEIITSKEDLTRIYTQGTGSVRVRARYRIEAGQIIIYELPYQVSGEKIQIEIAAQMQAKKLPMLEDIRDESDHEDPVRIVLIPRSNRMDAELIMNHLFVTTDLEKSFRVNMNMIGLDERPCVKNLHEILTEWIEFRRITVTRRLRYRLDKIEQRLHILTGLLVAYLNLDEVIRIIRFEDDPKTVLMNTFKISEPQAHAILETKLRHLARLEEIKLTAEESELNQERSNILDLLNNAQKLSLLIKTEITEDADKYGDSRRSLIVERESATAIDESVLVSSEAVTVIISKMGWVRAAKGHEVDPVQLSYKTGDSYLTSCQGRNNQQAVFFDSTGRSYSLATHTLPSARSTGDPLTSRFTLESGTQIDYVILDQNTAHYFLVASNGYGFIATYSEFITRQKAGKTIVNLNDGGQLLPPQAIQNLDHTYVAAITKQGRLLIVPLREIPILPRGKGNQIIAIPGAVFKRNEDALCHAILLPETANLIIHIGKRTVQLKPDDWAGFIGERGKRGKEVKKGVQIDRIEIALNN